MLIASRQLIILEVAKIQIVFQINFTAYLTYFYDQIVLMEKLNTSNQFYIC